MNKAYVRASVFGVLLGLLWTAVALATNTGRSQAVQDTAVVVGVRPSVNVSEYRSDLTAADTVTLTHSSGGIAAIATYSCAGYANLSVGGKLSVASATCVIHVYRCYYTAADGLVVKSKTKATLTAEGTLTDGSTTADYMTTNSATFLTEGAPIVKVVVEAPSSGQIDLVLEAY